MTTVYIHRRPPAHVFFRRPKMNPCSNARCEIRTKTIHDGLFLCATHKREHIKYHGLDCEVDGCSVKCKGRKICLAHELERVQRIIDARVALHRESEAEHDLTIDLTAQTQIIDRDHIALIVPTVHGFNKQLHDHMTQCLGIQPREETDRYVRERKPCPTHGFKSRYTPTDSHTLTMTSCVADEYAVFTSRRSSPGPK